MTKFGLGSVCLFLLWAAGMPRAASAQVVIVERNVNLRQDPSTAQAPIRLLRPPEEAALLEFEKTNGYYHVRSLDLEEGWVWARNVRVDPDRRLEITDIPVYDRDDWEHWSDFDGDCQDTRQEILIQYSLLPVVFEDSSECEVEAGHWIGLFSGEVFTDPSDVDIDHVVPLQNAHLSGGWAWSAEKKEAYANDLEPGHLLPVKDNLNQSKGSRGPEAWLPPNQTAGCTYGALWRRVKERWELTMTAAESAVADSLLALCEE